MGIPILILGESGTGKSASMRNFKEDEVALVNVAGKPLPFRGSFDETIDSDNYRKIKQFIKDCFANVIVIDDCQYLMANEFMRRAAERGFDKFTEIGVNFWDLVNMVKELPPEKIVIFMSHIDRDDSGNEKMKTIGKLLDDKINIPGMFTIVLKTSVKDGKYSFITQNSGHDPVKSPMGMFPAEIDNDLKAAIDTVRNYYFGSGEPFPTPVEPKVEPSEPKVEPKVEPTEPSEPKVEPKVEPTEPSEPPKRKRRTRKER